MSEAMEQDSGSSKHSDELTEPSEEAYSDDDYGEEYSEEEDEEEPETSQQRAVREMTEGCKLYSTDTFCKVHDPEYRSAKVLHAASFFTDFRLEQHSILSEVAAISCPDAGALTARLDKLNVYSQGDFFRPHIDTPHGDSMVGSLVVCLPSPHQGGALVVSHFGSQVTYDWGASLQSQPGAVHWAFLFSDVQHEVQPVTQGYRLTLTYHVFASPAEQPPKPALDLAAMPLGQALHKALADPDFLPEGGKLGFACAHLYPHTGKGFTAQLLKGADRLVLQTAAALQLPAVLQPVWKSDQWDFCEKEYDDGGPQGQVCQCTECCKADGRATGLYQVGGPLEFSMLHDCLIESEGDEVQPFPPQWQTYSAADITWVQSSFKWQLGMAGMAWGNESSVGTMYCAAAVIVEVPAAPQRCS